jgi:hypothetical protein
MIRFTPSRFHRMHGSPQTAVTSAYAIYPVMSHLNRQWPLNPPRLDAGEVLLAAEIILPGSRAQDTLRSG